MRDRVRGLEEMKCQIGVQKRGENGYERLTFITPQPEYEMFSLQGQPKTSAPMMECLHDARSGVSRSRPSDGRPGRWKDIEEVSKRL